MSILKTHHLLLLLSISLLFSACGSNKSDLNNKNTSNKDYKLVWADEFEYSGLPDSTKWNYDIGGHGWGNEALFTPRLTVVGDVYLVRQVKNFQKGVRGAHEEAKFGKQMKMMSVLVTDQELNDIAAFLNEQSTLQ